MSYRRRQRPQILPVVDSVEVMVAAADLVEAVDLVDNHHPQVREVMVSLLPEVAVVVQVPLTRHLLSMVEMAVLVSFSSHILPN